MWKQVSLPSAALLVPHLNEDSARLFPLCWCLTLCKHLFSVPFLSLLPLNPTSGFSLLVVILLKYLLEIASLSLLC